MHADDYQTQASATAVPAEHTRALTCCLLGLSGEVGEIHEKVKKHLRAGGHLSDTEWRNGVAHELGDLQWYVARMAQLIGWDLSEVMRFNLM